MAENPFDFSARVALVTGCGSAGGIGFASARLLAQLGARVAITSTTAARIEARAAELRTEGADVFAGVADLTDRSQAFELVAAARSAFGSIDVLVNAAGMMQNGRGSGERELWRSVAGRTRARAGHHVEDRVPHHTGGAPLDG